jgi:hypothetical protein
MTFASNSALAVSHTGALAVSHTGALAVSHTDMQTRALMEGWSSLLSSRMRHDADNCSHFQIGRASCWSCWNG